jgi:hypothetical protein
MSDTKYVGSIHYFDCGDRSLRTYTGDKIVQNLMHIIQVKTGKFE